MAQGGWRRADGCFASPPEERAFVKFGKQVFSLMKEELFALGDREEGGGLV